ncbi:MAG TPA: hypothetical protein VJ717_04240 [Gemmatimonadaceae bacterium]|nr:hypothetical protein [Gemmatimonadaceae bacterium]
MTGAGGTPGGTGKFLLGAALIIAGGYWLLTRVTVASGGWYLWGYNAFGLSMVPLLIGIGLLFFNGRSLAGWILTSAGAVIILAGIIGNLQIHFRGTSLFDTLLMLGFMAAGIGLVAASLKSAAATPDRKTAP